MARPRCKIDNCVNLSHTDGICATHNDRKKRGWPDWDTRPIAKRPPGYGKLKDYEPWEKLLFRNYGLEKGGYEQMLDEQAGGCAICGEPCHTGRRLSVDHDHNCCPENARSCGECIRGLLCGHCNQGIGKFKDDPELLITAAFYLLAHAREESLNA